VKTILRVFVLLLIAFGLARFFLAGDSTSGRPWEKKYGPRSCRSDIRPDGTRVVESYEGVMGTLFVVEYEAPDAETADRAGRALWQRVWDLEQTLSTWIPASLLSRVNRDAARGPVRVDRDTMRVLRTAESVWKRSDGAFDPTVGPLLAVWKPLATLSQMPHDDAIARARDLVGFGKVVLLAEPPSVQFTEEGVSLDVGGVAKGYAAEAAARAAIEAGATACRVNAGGDVFAAGAPRDSPAGFPVMIRDPDAAPDRTLPGLEFPLLDRAVATSGNYERYTEIAGKRYSHILDPRTGRPVSDAVVQVTVIAGEGAQADALATALTVLGVERGLDLVRGLRHVEALFLYRKDGKLAMRGSPWFEARLR